MTPETHNTLLAWLFYGLAIVGAYIVVIAPFLYIYHRLHKVKPPLLHKRFDKELKRWGI
jgi:hypothetical protein